MRPFSQAGILRHLTRPARGGAAAVIVVFALLLWLAANAGMLGIPLGLILASWLFKYAYILFDQTVYGFDEPPTLDIQMLNPLEEQRPLAQLIILGLIYIAVTWVQSRLGSTAALILASAAALLLPASIAILGLERNILKAAYPVAWVRMAAGLGPLYLLVLALIAGYALLALCLQHWQLWLPLRLAIDMFAVLSLFSVLGGAMYERRYELELDTWQSPERTEERLRKEELGRSTQTVTEAYGLMRAGSHVKAWQLLQDWLAGRDHQPQDYGWLCEHLASWSDARYANRLTEDYVERLLALRRNGEALDLVTQRLQQDPTFRPKSATATLTIAQLAAQGGGAPRVARTLLADFAARFAGDITVAAAATLARQLQP